MTACGTSEPKEKLVQVHSAASHIASPRADSVFVGQCLSVVHCPPANLYKEIVGVNME